MSRQSTTPVVEQLLILAVVPVLIGFVSDSLWAIVAGTARSKLFASDRRMKVASRAGAASLIGLGVTVAVQGVRRS